MTDFIPICPICAARHVRKLARDARYREKNRAAILRKQREVKGAANRDSMRVPVAST